MKEKTLQPFKHFTPLVLDQRWGTGSDIQPTSHMCPLYLAQMAFGAHQGGEGGSGTSSPPPIYTYICMFYLAQMAYIMVTWGWGWGPGHPWTTKWPPCRAQTINGLCRLVCSHGYWWFFQNVSSFGEEGDWNATQTFLILKGFHQSN